MKQSICLAMIVKDEGHVIRRCLESVMPLVDCVVIHDTGSTDDTLGVMYSVRENWGHLDFQISRVPWVNFEHNRNLVNKRANLTGAGYILTIDADEVMQGTRSQRPILTHDLYNIPVEYNGILYNRPALYRNDGTFWYKGWVHEYVYNSRENTGFTQTLADWGWRIKVYHEGARSKDPETYIKDAQLLEASLKTMQSRTFDWARTMFYIAQSYRDAGEYSKARLYYANRAASDQGWDQERWYAQLQYAKLAPHVNYVSMPEMLEEFMTAYEMMPERAESLYYAALNVGTRWNLKEMLLRAALAIPCPDTGLFLEPDVYKFLVPFELSVTLYYTNKREESLRIMKRLLFQEDLPDNLRVAIENNLKFYPDGSKAIS